MSAQEIMDLYVHAPPKWIIKYYDSAIATYVEVPACKFGGSSEELNGQESASFLIRNTEENRAFVLNDYPVQIFYDGKEVFGASNQLILKGYTADMTKLSVVCYNQVYENLQKRTVTYSADSVAADVVLAEIQGIGGGSSTQKLLAHQAQLKQARLVLKRSSKTLIVCR